MKVISLHQIKDLCQAVAVVQQYVGKKNITMKLYHGGAAIFLPSASLNFVALGEGLFTSEVSIKHAAPKEI